MSVFFMGEKKGLKKRVPLHVWVCISQPLELLSHVVLMSKAFTY